MGFFLLIILFLFKNNKFCWFNYRKRWDFKSGHKGVQQAGSNIKTVMLVDMLETQILEIQQTT